MLSYTNPLAVQLLFKLALYKTTRIYYKTETHSWDH